MDNKDFVPYQLSLDMKELGFNEPCFGYYNGQGNYIGEEGKMNSNCNKLGMHGAYCTAPTFSQAFRWFREKYKLNGEVNHLPNVEKYGIITSDMTDIKPKDLSKNENFERGKKVTNDFVKYETYEEAELVCLIKLIQIVKNNTL